MFVLDTDHLTIVQQQSTPAYEYVLQRVHQHAPSAFFVSIISFHEQVMGWNAYLSQATNAAAVVRGYERLGRVLANFSTAQVLPFDEAAAPCLTTFARDGCGSGSWICALRRLPSRAI